MKLKVDYMSTFFKGPTRKLGVLENANAYIFIVFIISPAFINEKQKEINEQ